MVRKPAPYEPRHLPRQNLTREFGAQWFFSHRRYETHQRQLSDPDGHEEEFYRARYYRGRTGWLKVSARGRKFGLQPTGAQSSAAAALASNQPHSQVEQRVPVLRKNPNPELHPELPARRDRHQKPRRYWHGTAVAGSPLKFASTTETLRSASRLRAPARVGVPQSSGKTAATGNSSGNTARRNSTADEMTPAVGGMKFAEVIAMIAPMRSAPAESRNHPANERPCRRLAAHVHSNRAHSIRRQHDGEATH